MRMRGVAAAVAGLVGAAGAHALDRAGLLPGVHETVAVRAAMTPALTAGWLGLAAVLAGLAARTRPAVVAPVSAVVVSAVPELVGRHDPGAVAEPGALAGALLQALLVLVVLALGVLADRGWSPVTAPDLPATRWHVGIPAVRRGFGRDADRRARPRAPPLLLSPR